MTMKSGTFENVLVWRGAELVPTPCRRFVWNSETISDMDDSKPTQTPLIGILPGFVNAHTHIGDSFLPEAAVSHTLEEAFFRPDGLKYRKLESLSEKEHVDSMVEFHRQMSSSGTVAHFDFREQGVEGAKRLRKASNASGIRSVILNQFRDSPQTSTELEQPERGLSESAKNELREMLKVADGFSESTMNDLTDAAWREVNALTKEAGKARAIHCLESETYRDTSIRRSGRGDLIRALEILEPDVVVHLTVANPEEIQQIASTGVPAVINVRANASLGLPMPPVAELLEAGVRLLVGTDNGILNGPDLFRELDAVYRLACSQAGEDHRPPPTEILKMVTSNVANTRWGKELPGQIEAGMPATFTVVDLSSPHFQNSFEPTATLMTRATPADVMMTVLHGNVLYQRKGNS